MSRSNSRIKVLLDSGRWIVKTAENREELRAALQLRHDVFFHEQLGQQKASKIDQDEYDHDSDHLIIVEKHSQNVVGNYRIRCSSFVDRFYSESEFTLGGFLGNLKGVKLEVGRACVHPGSRSGAAIQLLWKGLMAYAQAADARYIFGCSSWKCLDRAKIKFQIEQLRLNGSLMDHLGVTPIVSYQQIPSSYDGSIDFEALPSLLKMYLRSGARILGEPAYDQEFQCVDFLTFLDLSQMPVQYSSRYLQSYSAVAGNLTA